jgi:hypothetical protein
MRQIAFWGWASLGQVIDAGCDCKRRQSNPKLNNSKALGFPNSSQISPKIYLGRICNINDLRLIKGRFASLGFAGWLRHTRDESPSLATPLH